ncbi:hypothetical protein CEXT_539421 [Caerostris extrusa]|uniref:Uncharacterized protein n=1 Tax=Caerostris extrusa TaxID=172846 RepID=A0AAV4MN80_CAEEX|nr:hypothetical protein CEXT_539421 [Caerostris extrusa]
MEIKSKRKVELQCKFTVSIHSVSKLRSYSDRNAKEASCRSSVKGNTIEELQFTLRSRLHKYASLSEYQKQEYLGNSSSTTALVVEVWGLDHTLVNSNPLRRVLSTQKPNLNTSFNKYIQE